MILEFLVILQLFIDCILIYKFSLINIVLNTLVTGFGSPDEITGVQKGLTLCDLDLHLR
jgi:hypothetical protein